jgi:hypothetical protein
VNGFELYGPSAWSTFTVERKMGRPEHVVLPGPYSLKVSVPVGALAPLRVAVSKIGVPWGTLVAGIM